MRNFLAIPPVTHQLTNIKITFFVWDLARQNKILHFKKKTLVSNYIDA